MFDRDEIERKAAELKLLPADVERDYIQSWIIKETFKNDYLAPQLTLKGSAALRKLYYPETRFARDIDFSARSHVDKSILEDQLHKIGKDIEKQTGIKFVEEVKIIDKNLPQEMEVDALEARMYFKSVYSEGKFDLKTQVDVTRSDAFYLPPAFAPIIHPYFDASEMTESRVRGQKIEEIIATKFITLLHRKKPGDLWDLTYATFISNAHQINRLDVIKALLARTNFGNSVEEARNTFLGLPIAEKYKQTWSGLLIPAHIAVPFEEVSNTFLTSIGGFFDEMAGYVGSFVRRAIGGSHGTPTLSNTFRDRIVSGGQKRHLLKLTYSDKERLVEPYKLEYYTRESDGETHEYFWGYDQSGGTSDKVSIKRFTAGKIQHVEETEEIYIPQWEVEF